MMMARLYRGEGVGGGWGRGLSVESNYHSHACLCVLKFNLHACMQYID